MSSQWATRVAGLVLLAVLHNAAGGSPQAGPPLSPPLGPRPAILPLSGSPNPLDLGVRRLGSPPVSQALTVLNATGRDVQLNSLLIQGKHASEFAVVAPGALPILMPSGSNLVVDAQFTPAERGPRRARVLLKQTPSSNLQGQVELLGMGIGPTGAEIFINSGGGPQPTSAGDPFSADYGSTGVSTTLGFLGLIGSTPDPQLYLDIREGSSFGYSLGVPNGSYEVTLHFVEFQHFTAGQRVFNVSLEGDLVIDGLDLYGTIGNQRAYIERHVTEVLDGMLDVGFQGVLGSALVAALEVRSIALPVASPASVSFGAIHPGGVEFRDVEITNLGLHPASFSQLEIELTGSGDPSEFTVTLEGSTYAGGSSNVSYPLSFVLPAGGSTLARVTYTPITHQTHGFTLRLGGNFDALEVPVTGTGGSGGDPFLHAVALVPGTNVDYDDDGLATVHLDGTDSHTHEPGHVLTTWEWSQAGVPFSQLEEDWCSFPLGQHTVRLDIWDDNVPPRTEWTEADFSVFPSGAVPGALALYHDATGTGLTPQELLDQVPVTAEFAEVLPQTLEIAGRGTLGGSPFTGNVMVRVLAALAVAKDGTHDFLVTGPPQWRLYVDGGLWSGPAFLTQGTHALEVRWAVDDLSQAPLTVLSSSSGGSYLPIPGEQLTHDVKSVRPVINSMPSLGISSGGNQIVIEGFGFFMPDEVVVHWGTQVLAFQDFLACDPHRIEFLSPPGTGAIEVRVETPRGLSNKRIFDYQTQGPVPIVFNTGPVLNINQPTAAAWGPDHKLYLVTRPGELKVITFDAAYNVGAVSTHPGVSGLSNREAMGIAFNPYDASSPVRVYISHTAMFAQGGGAFTGRAPYPGQVSVLVGPDFDQPQALITQLPTSNHDHGTNALEFDHNGDLLLSLGGNTNAGIKWWSMGDLPESPLTGALLRARTSRQPFQGALSYVETASGLANNDQVFGDIVSLAPGSSVEIYATGLRNCFDFALTTWGKLYATDNGPNTSYGPASTGASSQSGAHPGDQDELLLVEFGRYYGHPNRNRGRYENHENIYFNTSSPATAFFTQHMAVIPSSSNGIVEYTSATFGGQMRGELLALKYNEQLRRIRLSADKRSVQSLQVLPVWLGGLNVLNGPGGALLSIDYAGNKLRMFPAQDASAVALSVHDITPWRGPAGGGTPFVIGGAFFGTLADTVVRIDGIQAQLLSVSSTRIWGIVPAHPNPPSGLVNVQVSVGPANNTLQAAFQYLPATPGLWMGTWKPAPSMPVALGEVASGILAGRVFVVGEGNNQTLSYNILTGVWSNAHPVRPHVGHHHAAEVHNGKWYLIGGLHAGAGKVQIFDVNTNSWSLGADMPWTGGAVSTAKIGAKIYASGGIVGNTTVDNCAVYDIAANTWTSLASMPFQKGRNHAASGTEGTRLWIFGGRGIGSGPGNNVANGFADVQVYDPATDTWDASYMPGSSLVPLPIGRGGMGKAVFYQGEFLVFGGETLNGPGAVAGNVYNRVDTYLPQTNTWRLDKPMLTPRHGVFPVLHQGRIFVAGGGVVAGNSQTAVMDIFER